MRTIACALALVAVSATAAAAYDLKPSEGRSLDFGGVTGVAYYVPAKDGYHVVATQASSESTSPMRFATTLADRQTVTIAAPGLTGEADKTIVISRHGNTVSVLPGDPASN